MHQATINSTETSSANRRYEQAKKHETGNTLGTRRVFTGPLTTGGMGRDAATFTKLACGHNFPETKATLPSGDGIVEMSTFFATL